MGTTSGLAKAQRRTLAALTQRSLGDHFYLAGGAAVAVHLRHRRSNDLDLFSYDSEADLKGLTRQLADVGDLRVLSETESAIKLRVDEAAVDVVRYPYPLLESPSAGPEGFPIAGLLDLATMKLSAIAVRGIRRDFWDLHEILTRTSITLDGALDAYLRRFGVAESDIYHVLRSLTYFDDAEKDEAMPEALNAEHWHAIKRYFETEAPNALRSRIRPL